jgi:hypothetical protein
MLDNMPSNYTKEWEQVFTNQGRSPWGHVLAGCLELTSEGTFFDAKDLVQAYFAVNILQQNMVFPKTVAQITIMPNMPFALKIDETKWFMCDTTCVL